MNKNILLIQVTMTMEGRNRAFADKNQATTSGCGNTTIRPRQGFPDEAHDAVKAAGISDSQRYKQAGNAVTVNVVEAIGKRLIPLIS